MVCNQSILVGCLHGTVNLFLSENDCLLPGHQVFFLFKGRSAIRPLAKK
jgi:hypothetical protein